ncbi:permease [Candidatus Flexifilum breve]|uniref:permease n=1 Tax=Candidatus Flexifilum breve TaxID=3140694 RepID=UPI0031CC763F
MSSSRGGGGGGRRGGAPPRPLPPPLPAFSWRRGGSSRGGGGGGVGGGGLGGGGGGGGAQPRRWRRIAGTFMGFAFPVCECGVVPVVRRLYTKGLPMSVGVTFLLAAPVINPVVLVSTYVAFGAGTVLIGRFVITALVAFAVGLVFAVAARPQDVLQPTSLAPVMGGDGEVIPLYAKTRRKPLLVGLRDALRMAGDEFFDMGRYLIIGSLLAALMQTLVSQDVLLALGRGPVVSVITMQLLAFVLSVCSTVDSFLALAFAGTFTTGSILAFLTFGPMVDIKSTLMFAGVFKRRVVLYLILLPLLMTMLVGIWLNLNITF